MDEKAARGELFGAALDAFVETRARLAAALAAAGLKVEGQALKKVRRPSPSAWATNQVVRHARAEVDGFLAASDRLRGSQAALVAGSGDRGIYQADVEELRRATAALSEAARVALADLGRREDRALVDRVVANARAAALTDVGRRALLEGELVADVGGGVDAFGGLLDAGPAGAPASGSEPARSAPSPRAPDASREPEARAREHEARRREQEAREAARAREVDEARRDEAAAREASTAAEAATTLAREALEAARRRVEEAQRAARETERALRDAEAALRSAQRDAAEAETRAGRATRRRERLEEGPEK
jgi:hypothetical protein